MLGLFHIAPASAQTFNSLTEIVVPSDPRPVDVSTEAYFSVDVVIRSGQKLRFDHGNSGVATFDVGLDGLEPLTRIAVNTSSPVVLWNQTPTAPGSPREVRVEWRTNGVTHSYEFDLPAVPQASRAFTLREGIAPDTLQHELFVWSDGPATLDKPLIVVEGIGGPNRTNAAVYYALGRSVTSLTCVRGQPVSTCPGSPRASTSFVCLPTPNLCRAGSLSPANHEVPDSHLPHPARRLRPVRRA